jgi:hypothetical protein
LVDAADMRELCDIVRRRALDVLAFLLFLVFLVIGNQKIPDHALMYIM